MNITFSNPLAQVITHRELLWQLVLRDVLLRYRGAMFGVVWAFIQPLVMLVIYAFVFGQILQFRWPPLPNSSPVPGWILLYGGLLTFNIFADTLSRAPISVRAYPSYVKKIIFPLQILPMVPLGAALVHAVFGFLILLIVLISMHCLHATFILIPLLLLPLLFVVLGLSWFIAAWGVFIKDVAQLTPIFLQMLMFISPVFYPSTSVPKYLQPLFQLNPLAIVIEAVRAASVGNSINWLLWILVTFGSLVICIIGYGFFMHAREEFADVL